MLIGILADTHIPYRVSTLPEYVLQAFQDVDLILHAGDVDETEALSALAEIAPVRAVRGNYHIFDRSSGGKQFPEVQKLSLCGFNIVVTHGHRLGWLTLFWRMYNLLLFLVGRQVSPLSDQFVSRSLIRRFPDADIYVFGHTHRFFTQYIEGKLMINPGAACAASYLDSQTEMTVALLKIRDREIASSRTNRQ